MSKVAVWMTVFNEERYLQETIDVVRNQTFTDFTLYISDNHSTDDSWQVIKHNALLDERIVYMKPPEHIAGIPHMAFVWEMLSGRGELPLELGNHDYSILIGGHDKWPVHHLQVLVDRMDQERRLRDVALIYTDTFQMDENGQLSGRYQDICQVGQIGKPFIPLHVITGVNKPQAYGLWNEEIRKRLPVRHLCGGWDHLIVMEAALHGAVLFESATALLMRGPAPTDSLESYGRRHLDARTLTEGPADFLRQMEWCIHAADESLSDIPANAAPLYQALLTASLALTYIALRGQNLHAVPGAMQEFNEGPEVQQIFAAAQHIERQVRRLTGLTRKDARQN